MTALKNNNCRDDRILNAGAVSICSSIVVNINAAFFLRADIIRGLFNVIFDDEEKCRNPPTACFLIFFMTVKVHNIVG